MGINWGPKGGRNTRKEKKNTRGKSTAGKDKALSCQASSLDKFMAKYSRSYKTNGYNEWCVKKNGV